MRLRPLVLLGADLCLVASATVSALLLRENFMPPTERLDDYSIYLGLTTAIAAIVILVSRTHLTVWRFVTPADHLSIAGLTAFIVLATVAIGFQVNRLEGIPRALPVLQAILIVGFLVTSRVAYRHFRARRRASLAADAEEAMQAVLVVGVNPVSELFLRSVDDLARGTIRVAGVIAEDDEHLRGRRIGGYEILGTLVDLPGVIAQLTVHGVEIDRIVVTSRMDEVAERGRQVLAGIEAEGAIQVDYFAARLGFSGPQRLPYGDGGPDLTGVPRTSDAVRAPSTVYRAIKRVADIGLAAILLVLLAPLIVLVALVVALDVGNPVTFWQQRPGLRGRPFRLYKFRTMRAAHDHHGHRVPDHERLSAVGQALRRTRLDELPQLVNILVGHMSFVGPRPLLPIDQPEDARKRLQVRPGLTGWAQVMGGRDITPADKAALDEWYVANMSFSLDLEIAMRTIPMVIVGERIDPLAIRRACDATGRTADHAPARALDGEPARAETLSGQTRQAA